MGERESGGEPSPTLPLPHSPTPVASDATLPKVGIPRIGMFNDYYPFYRAFFSELGFEVVPSDATSKQIMRDGVQHVAAEPCFPIKVAHGHAQNAMEKGVEFLFLPAVMRAEPLDEEFCEHQTCPYIQALPELLDGALRLREQGVTLLTPRLYFNRGRKHLIREFSRMFTALAGSASGGNGHARRAGGERSMGSMGSTGSAAPADSPHSPHSPYSSALPDAALSPRAIEHALDVAAEALDGFRRRVARRGEEILTGLPKDAVAFVVMGRPYTLHDTAVNMSIGKKIQDLGILAIPQDFLPLQTAGITEAWRGIYSRQVQNRLAAARLIREDPRLRAVVLTYFGCGPDSFANQFLRDELNEPAYVMQIDEHTADAGVITRIEAFADTVRSRQEPEAFTPFTTDSAHPAALDGKTLWVPDASTAARVLAAAFNAYDIKARVLPRSPDAGLNLARAAIPEDVCVPALFTTEDILYRTRQPDFDPAREAFFQGNAAGPCRYGMYALLQKRILDKAGLPMVDMATLGARNVSGTLSTTSSLVIWDALVTHDLLEKMLLHTRPYEVNAGDSDALFERYVEQACALVKPHRDLVESAGGKIAVAFGHHLERFKDLLRRAQAEFAVLPRRQEQRPLVGVIGEFYVRLHDRSNQDVVRKLERGGAEVVLAPMTEFFSYANRIKGDLSREEHRDTGDRKAWKQWAVSGFQDWLAVHDEHRLWEAALPYMEGFEEMTPAELIAKGGEFVHHTFGGEAICSMGKAVDMIQRGLDGIVSAIPFNCMPGITVQALSHTLRRRYGNVPFLTLDFDGFVDSGRDSRLAGFLAQVLERRAARALSDQLPVTSDR